MGWAKKHLSEEERRGIAAGLFAVKELSGSWQNGLCPFHEDANPSFGYNAVEDVFHCHAACCKDGDLVDLFCQVNGLGKQGGFLEFRKLYGSEEDGHRPPPTPRPPRKPAPGNPGKAAQDQAEKPKPKKADEDLPPVDPAQMAEAYAMFPALPEKWQERLFEVCGWSREIIARHGLKLQSHYRCRYTGVLKPVNQGHGRIVIPIYDEDSGVLANMRLYDPNAREAKIISWGKGVGGNRLYPAPARGGYGLVLLCEGEKDTLCARSLGYEAYTQTSKRKKWPEDQIRPFRGRDVVICYDADLPGQDYARSAAASLLGQAGSVRLLHWPDYMLAEDGALPEKHGEDFVDFVVKHKKGRADFEALLAAATEYTDEEAACPALQFFGETLGGRYSFQPRLLAERLRKDVDLLLDPKTDLLYRWNGKYFEEYPEKYLKKLAIEYLGNEAVQARYNDAVNQAIHLSTIPYGRQVNDRENISCLKNGMFNVDSFELLPHHKEYFSTIQINVEFDPTSPPPCPRWMQFCEETIQKVGPIMQFQEFFGYCFTRDTRYEKGLWALGDGANGKSLAMRILRHLVGPENCTSVSFEGLEDQFQRVSLFGKLVNISTEAGHGAIDSQYYKKIVSGDDINAAFKHKDSFNFTPFAKQIFALNQMQKIKDNTDGFYRKVLPIMFRRQFLEDDPDRDPFLEKKLLAESPGIFGWAMAGLVRVRKQNGFTRCEETERLIDDFRRQNNPVQCFVEDKCVIGLKEEIFTEKQLLYNAYRTYCGEKGYGPVHEQNFFRELRIVLKNMEKRIIEYRRREGDERTRCLKGIGLKL